MDDNIMIAGIAQGPDVDSIPTEPPEASPYTQELLWDLVSKSGETLTSEAIQLIARVCGCIHI